MRNQNQKRSSGMMYYTGDYRTAWNNLSHGQIVTSQCPLSEGHYTTKNGELKLVDGDGAWCYSFDGATLRFLVGTGAIDFVAFASLE